MSTCDLGVGCEETGVCYAIAHGQPDKCGAAPPDACECDLEPTPEELDRRRCACCGGLLP
jgi:hypothetical protein